MDQRQQSPQQIVFLSIFLASLTLVIGTVLTISTNIQYGQTFAPIALIFYISRLSPFAFGTWAALMWPGSHPRAYILIGLCIGLVDMTALVAAVSAIYGQLPFGAAGWIEHFSYHALLPIVLFVSGGLFGDFVKENLGARSANYVLGVVAAAVTALGTIITALIENS